MKINRKSFNLQSKNMCTIDCFSYIDAMNEKLWRYTYSIEASFAYFPFSIIATLSPCWYTALATSNPKPTPITIRSNFCNLEEKSTLLLQSQIKNNCQIYNGFLGAAYDSNSFLIINRIEIRITTSTTFAFLCYRVQR